MHLDECYRLQNRVMGNSSEVYKAGGKRDCPVQPRIAQSTQASNLGEGAYKMDPNRKESDIEDSVLCFGSGCQDAKM